jgi:hypothetical protein
MCKTQLLTVFVLPALLLAACGGSPSPTPAPATPTSISVPTDTPAPPVEEAAATAEPAAEEAESEAVQTEEITTPAPGEEAEAQAATATEAESEEATTAAPATAETAAGETTTVEAGDEASTAETPAAADTGTEPPVAIAATGFTVTAMRRVSDIINERFVPMATIAPDGSAIAYLHQTGRRSGSSGKIIVQFCVESGHHSGGSGVESVADRPRISLDPLFGRDSNFYPLLISHLFAV